MLFVLLVDSHQELLVKTWSHSVQHSQCIGLAPVSIFRFFLTKLGGSKVWYMVFLTKLWPTLTKLVVHGTDQLVVSKSWGYPKNARWMVLVRENPINQNGWSPGLARHDEKETPKWKTGWWFQLLWKIWKSLGMIIPKIWENKKWQPKHQPVKNHSLQGQL